MKRKTPEKLPALSEMTVDLKTESHEVRSRTKGQLGTAAILAAAVAGGVYAGSKDVRESVDEAIWGKKLPELSSQSVTVCSPTEEQAMRVLFDAEGEVAWMAETTDGSEVAFIGRFQNGEVVEDRLPRIAVESAVISPVVCEQAGASLPLSARNKNGNLMLTVNQNELEVRLPAYNSSPEKPANIEAVGFEARERLSEESVNRLKLAQDSPEDRNKVRSEFMQEAAFRLVEDHGLSEEIEKAYQDFMREDLTARVRAAPPEYDDIEVSFRGTLEIVPPNDIIPEVEVPEKSLKVNLSEDHGAGSKMFIGTEAQE